MWKLKNFSVTLILREFKEFDSKLANLRFRVPNFVKTTVLEILHFIQNQFHVKSEKKKNRKILKFPHIVLTYLIGKTLINVSKQDKNEPS